MFNILISCITFADIRYQTFGENYFENHTNFLSNFLINYQRNSYRNIEYPKIIVQALLKHDLDLAKYESRKLLLNSIIGVLEFINITNKFFRFKHNYKNKKYVFINSQFEIF